MNIDRVATSDYRIIIRGKINGLPLRKSIFFTKIDFEISTYPESPKCPLSDYVCFVAL